VSWDDHSIRQLQRGSIDTFLNQHGALLTGRVLEFGPRTRSFASSEAHIDQNETWPIGGFDAIVCVNVVPRIADPVGLFSTFRMALNAGGYLLLTYPCCWPEEDREDLWRFTRPGMDMLLKIAGLQVLVHEELARIALGSFTFPLGYGVVAAK
jgi:hypothetical protein